ncbi:MAG TPA: thioredoxin family protein [Gammaproteobacteria bacterium]|nr:thioredoxin family protein [Gammaproteobacteria bacterium]
MKNIKVLGSGCTNCKTTLKLIDTAAKETGTEIELEKVEDIGDIMSYGVMSTPGVVIDGKLVHAGGIPSKQAILAWLNGKPATNCCGSSKAGDEIGCCGE